LDYWREYTLNESSLYNKEIELQTEADIALRQYWMKYTFLTWEFWLLTFLLLFPWVVWWRVVDRKRLFEILTYGFLVMVVSLVFDAIGVEFDLWEYQHQLVPLFDVFVVYDFSVLPVTYMIAYQYFNKWKSFIVAHIIIAGIFAFVSEPLLMPLNFYKMLQWEHYYSFPLYFAMAVILKWVMTVLKRKVL